MIRNLLIDIGIPVHLNMLHKMAGVNPLIINYHMVSDKHLPYIVNLYRYRNINSFNKEIKFLARNYHVLGLQEFIHIIRTDAKLPDKSLLITFDDGFREIFDYAAPILLEHTVPATFFLTNDFIDNKVWGHDNIKSLIIDKLKKEPNLAFKLSEHFHSVNHLENLISQIIKIPYKSREKLDNIASLLELDLNQMLLSQKPYLTTDQINHLISSGFTIGSHSLDHADFRELSLDEQLNHLSESIEDIRKRFGIDYSVFAFPYTDLGVSQEFFSRISGWMDATFGTQGHLRDELKTHFQRINLEKFPQRTKRMLKYYYLHSIGHKILGKGIIRHT